MTQSYRDTGHSCNSRSRVVHVSTRSCLSGTKGQLGFQVNWGKSKLVPMQRIFFLGMELDSDNQTARLTQVRAQSVLNSFRGSWGIWLQLRRSSARSAPYETASTVAPWPSPEVGVETRYSPGSDYTGLPQNLQPVDRPFVPSGRSAPGTDLQACCGIHGCLGHRLGSHVQWARSVRGMDGSPTALAYQLPRVAGSTPCLEPPQRVPSGQGRSGPYGQRGDHCVYQPARRFMLPSHVATRPPAPPLESEASEVPSCHPHPRSVQPGGRRAVSSSTSWGVETPSPGGPADWSWFGAAQVDLFASPETTHCQWFYSLTEATLGTDALAHSWPRGLHKYAFPPVSLIAQTLCKIREDKEQVLLVAPYWPNRTWFPELMLLATAPPWPIPLRKGLLSQRRGTLWHPRPDLWKLNVWSLDGTRRF